MKTTVMTTLAGAMALAMATGTQAGTVSFDPSATTAGIGDSFDISILGDFAGEYVYGADFDLIFDSAVVALTGVTFDTAVWDFGVSSGTPSAAGQDDIAVNANAAYPTGSFTFATLHFNALSAGDALISLAGSSILYGCGVGATYVVNGLGATCDGYDYPLDGGGVVASGGITPDATVTVAAAAPIPLPAAVWTLSLGLAGLGVLGRRRLGAR